MVVGGQADRGVGDEGRQRSGEGNLVVADQAAADLKREEPQHCKDRQGADRGVAHAVLGLALALEVVDEALRRIDECAKT